jgi:hypothetical protein
MLAVMREIQLQKYRTFARLAFSLAFILYINNFDQITIDSSKQISIVTQIPL